ncbi:RNA-protein complex protein Nop10 [Nanoarchaeota archaeon]|nr:MAG: RNA-protein complex protein Nop10 [Nanoarchaeota archaeon]
MRIRYCPSCKRYTLKENCPSCGGKTILRVPPKFSPEDKYAKYRREVRRKLLKEVGLL